MGPGEAFSLITLFIASASVLILRGPLGRAWAERISGRSPDADQALKDEVEHLQSSVEELRHRLAETEERLDFAERLLAQQKAAPPLRPGD
jgi:hypothetical protein